VQKDLYALKPDNQPRDQRIESLALSAADGVCATALREFLVGKKPPEYSTLESIAYFAGLQSARLPSTEKIVSAMHKMGAEEFMRLTAVSVDRMKSTLDKYARDTGEAVNVTPESMVEAIRGKHLEVVVTEVPFLQHIFKHAESVSNALLQCAWELLEASPDTGFILSDSPMVVVPPNGGKDVGIHIPGAAKYFPLSRSACLRVGSVISGIPFRYRKVDRRAARVINHNIAANSERFVMGPSKEQVESVIVRSGSGKIDPTPKFTLDSADVTDDGSLQQIRRNPGRYFYLPNASEAP
jgi:hypothetical protein